LLTDIVLGIQHGDEGKGKVTHHLLKNGEYTHCVRFNGGCNAGHTIYHEGVKIVTHLIPAGVFFGVKSIIGPGCVVKTDKFFEEIRMLEDHGIRTSGLVKIASNAHITTNEHVNEDRKDETIGTTKSGNGPAYRDKYARTGMRASECSIFDEYVVDMYDELDGAVALMEGAQGFWLDIDWGDYPYVTSSHCGVGAAILNGVNPRSIRNIWGVAKIYETYVGKKCFQPNNRVFDQIQKAGSEFGATTGRARQCDWMDFGKLNKAIRMNGVNKLVFNKMDILREVNKWGIKNPNLNFSSEQEVCSFIEAHVASDIDQVFFSDSPEKL
jgi:adenylosuccinate synthase